MEEIAKRTRTTLRAKLSSDPEKYVDDAVRKQCGPQAQRLDREMREDMQQYRRHWEVYSRYDTMRNEERRAERARQETKSQQQDRPRTREPQGSRIVDRSGSRKWS